MDNRRVCINCKHYRAYRGVMGCRNRESGHMNKPTLPDDDCPEFERKEERKDDSF